MMLAPCARGPKGPNTGLLARHRAARTRRCRGRSQGGSGAFTPLAVDQAKPTYLAVANDPVYWTNQGDGTVWSQDVATPAAAPTQIANGQSTPLGITVDSSAVYWVNQSGDVMKAVLCGGGVLHIASNQGSLAEIVTLAGQVYWTAVGANQIVRVPE